MICVTVCFTCTTQKSATLNPDRKTGYVTPDGELVIPYKFDDGSYFSEGMAAVKKDSKWGYINKKGNIVVDFVYDYAGNFNEGYALVAQNKKFGYINKKGLLVIPMRYEGGTVFYNGFATVKKNDKVGAIDKKGNVVLNFEYGHYSLYSEGYFCIEKDFKYQYVTINGENPSGKTYDSAYPFYNGIAVIRKDKKNYIINSDFKIITEQNYFANSRKDMNNFEYKVYTYTEYFQNFNDYISKSIHIYQAFYDDGLIISTKNEKCGFVDIKGHTVIPHEYDLVSNFCNGFALATQNDKSYLIDKNNNKVVEFENQIWVKHFYSDTCIVSFFNKEKNIKGYYDVKGNIIYKGTLEFALPFHEGYAIIAEDSKWGAIDETGKLVLPLKYDYIASYGDGYFVVKKNIKN